MRLTALMLALTGAALIPSSASAYVVAGFAWPGTTIRYYTAAGAYRGAVDRAARTWNRAAVGVRLASGSRASADVVVTYGTDRCGGVSPMGYGGRYVGTTMRLGAGCSPPPALG